MMDTVRQAVSDTDLALLFLDGSDNLEENDRIFSGLHLKVPGVSPD